MTLVPEFKWAVPARRHSKQLKQIYYWYRNSFVSVGSGEANNAHGQNSLVWASDATGKQRLFVEVRKSNFVDP